MSVSQLKRIELLNKVRLTLEAKPITELKPKKKKKPKAVRVSFQEQDFEEMKKRETVFNKKKSLLERLKRQQNQDFELDSQLLDDDFSAFRTPFNQSSEETFVKPDRADILAEKTKSLLEKMRERKSDERINNYQLELKELANKRKWFIFDRENKKFNDKLD